MPNRLRRQKQELKYIVVEQLGRMQSFLLYATTLEASCFAQLHNYSLLVSGLDVALQFAAAASGGNDKAAPAVFGHANTFSGDLPLVASTAGSVSSVVSQHCLAHVICIFPPVTCVLFGRYYEFCLEETKRKYKWEAYTLQERAFWDRSIKSAVDRASGKDWQLTVLSF